MYQWNSKLFKLFLNMRPETCGTLRSQQVWKGWRLCSRSSAGPDGVPAVLLKKAWGSIALQLSLLWNKFMEVGEIPRVYKKCTISPIYKGRNRTLPRNYRPVTLTSHIIKLFEKFIVKYIVNFMDETDLYYNQQQSFAADTQARLSLLIIFSSYLWH